MGDKNDGSGKILGCGIGPQMAGTPLRGIATGSSRGYEARYDFDKAAAEAWACRTLKSADCTNEQIALTACLKALIGQDEYPATGVNDDIRFDWHVRTYLRKLAKMTKANEGFEKTLRHQ